MSSPGHDFISGLLLYKPIGRLKIQRQVLCSSTSAAASLIECGMAMV